MTSAMGKYCQSQYVFHEDKIYFMKCIRNLCFYVRTQNSDVNIGNLFLFSHIHFLLLGGNVATILSMIN